MFARFFKSVKEERNFIKRTLGKDLCIVQTAPEKMKIGSM